MSSIPIQLKFYKKLEFYQELRRQNRRATNSERLHDWENEKKILKWAARNHHHLNSRVSHDQLYWDAFADVRQEIEIEFKAIFAQFSEQQVKETVINHLKKKVGSLSAPCANLYRRGYASDYQVSSGLIFTNEGLLMGEVIDECENGTPIDAWKYPFFIVLVWATISSAALITIVSAINIIWDISEDIEKHL